MDYEWEVRSGVKILVTTIARKMHTAISEQQVHRHFELHKN
jgi:hypothetical protein